MIDLTSMDLTHLFLFVIPGFITVWSFRHFSNLKGNSDFEYFALSVFWGLILLAFNELLGSKEALAKLLQNPYATALVFSAIGFMFGLIGSLFSKDKRPQLVRWFKKYKKI